MTNLLAIQYSHNTTHGTTMTEHKTKWQTCWQYNTVTIPLMEPQWQNTRLSDKPAGNVYNVLRLWIINWTVTTVVIYQYTQTIIASWKLMENVSQNDLVILNMQSTWTAYSKHSVGFSIKTCFKSTLTRSFAFAKTTARQSCTVHTSVEERWWIVKWWAVLFCIVVCGG